MVTITDRARVEVQLPLLQLAPRVLPARRRILALHQDYANRALWEQARALGYEVVRGERMGEFLDLYREADVHLGNRVHAHLKCLSLGAVSFCTPFDLRQQYFAESLDYPLVTRIPDAALESYDFARVAARRDAARAAMDRFTARLRALIAS